tara:strand:- start:227 stop:379 length:153 start_codon:yes stop_codon:yes gene_type:complete
VVEQEIHHQYRHLKVILEVMVRLLLEHTTEVVVEVLEQQAQMVTQQELVE